ncbi:MAG: polyamine aminopropyltransferase, partial [bacterium]
MVTDLIYRELHSPHSGIFLNVKEYLHRSKSKFQQIEVFENETFGKVLILDGVVMLSERDEHYYHEMLVHPALTLLDEGMKVLIIGGGDGGTLRQVLKHNPSSVTIVEIDEDVINVSRKYFPLLASSFDDKRVKTIIGDGVEFVKKKKESGFDAVIVDSTDPVGPAEDLFSPEFYKAITEIISENGVFVTQSESPLFDKKFIVNLIKQLKTLFNNVENYIGPVPLYPAGIWS